MNANPADLVEAYLKTEKFLIVCMHFDRLSELNGLNITSKRIINKFDVL
jgi:hypothetical protein